MKYLVAIETCKIVEVEASSEESALKHLENQILSQNPNVVVNLKIVKETI